MSNVDIDFKPRSTIAVLAVALILVLGYASVYVIKSGTVGVVSRFGKYSDIISTAGLHFKIPLIENVTTMDIKMQTVNYAGHDQGVRNTDGIIQKEVLDVLDAQNVAYNIELTVRYTPNGQKMPMILTEYGENYFEKAINPVVRDIARNVGGQYRVETIADKREAIQQEIKAELAKAFKGLPFILNDANLRKIDLPPAIRAKIQDVQIAKQEEEKLKIDVRKAEQSKLVIQTQAEAAKSKQIIAAEADAQQQRLRADAKAYSVKVESVAQAEANKRLAQSLTNLLVKQNQIDKWNGQVPSVQAGEGTGLLLQMDKK